MNINVNKVKVMVTVPEENLEELREKLWEDNIGVMGNYSHCSTSTKCIGTFMPNENAHPYIGESHKLEIVREEKLEILCDIKEAKRVVKKIREVHPYEEPTIDIIPLIDEKELI